MSNFHRFASNLSFTYEFFTIKSTLYSLVVLKLNINAKYLQFIFPQRSGNSKLMIT